MESLVCPLKLDLGIIASTKGTPKADIGGDKRLAVVNAPLPCEPSAN